MKGDLLVVGLSHRTAPVEVRERLAVTPAEIEVLLRALRSDRITELAMISTCNRVEIYAVSTDGPAALGSLRDHMHERLGVAVLDQGQAYGLDRRLYQRLGREAVHHLFRVSASLDSIVVGEPQILGQVKEALEAAQRAGTVGSTLGYYFSRAFRAARRVRRETAIALQPISVSSVAVDLARTVWEGFSDLRVLIIGAGKMSDLAARSLRAQGATVAVTNRTQARAEELASRLGCEVEPFADLPRALLRADIVITSTGAREPIVGRELVVEVQKLRRGRPLVIIDIAVPRDVEASVEELDGVYLWNIDHLQREAQKNLQDRRQEAERAEVMVDEEVARALAVERGRAVGPTIAALRARLLGLARAEADKLAGKLPDLDDRGRREVQAMTEALVNKILHAPLVTLKDGASSAEGQALIEAVHKLFGLPELEVISNEDAAMEEGE